MLNSLFLILLTPLLTSLWVLINHKSPNQRDYGAIVFAIATFLQVAFLTYRIFPELLEPQILTLWHITPSITLSFRIDSLSLIFALLASGLWIVTTLYAIGYMRGHHEHAQTRFFAYFPIAISAALGIAFSGDLMALFFFYEILTFSTWPLVAHAETMKARKGARKYILTLVATSMMLFLPAIMITIITTGTAQFTNGGIAGFDGFQPISILILLAMFAWGIGKAALMPFHGWLPAAMVAPTPVSALLHAVAVVKAGVFTIIRVIMHIFGYERLADIPMSEFLSWVAIFTLLTASIIALRQDNLKRRLAFSTISQLSYIVLAASIFTPAAIIAAIMHIVGHAFGKITLFFGAGAIIVASHKTKVSQLDGIGRRMPITMAAFTIGILSVIGLPPTLGFITKFEILFGVAETNYLAAFALIISTFLNCAYLLPIIWRAWFKTESSVGSMSDPDVINQHGEAPLQCWLAMLITASLAVIFFAFPAGLEKFATLALGG